MHCDKVESKSSNKCIYTELRRLVKNHGNNILGINDVGFTFIKNVLFINKDLKSNKDSCKIYTKLSCFVENSLNELSRQESSSSEAPSLVRRCEIFSD